MANSLKDVFLDILIDNIEDMSREEAIHYIKNDAVPESGSVSGLIMYAETEEIGAKHHSELMEVVANNYGEMSKGLSLNDLVWLGWSAMLPEIEEEALVTTRIRITVPHSMIVALSNMKDNIWVDTGKYVDYANNQMVGIDTEIASEIDLFTREVQAYVFYMVDENESMEDIEAACEAIEEAYLDDEEYVDLES